jgi:hypothetical protein
VGDLERGVYEHLITQELADRLRLSTTTWSSGTSSIRPTRTSFSPGTSPN